jgi:hypothetical protein
MCAEICINKSILIKLLFYIFFYLNYYYFQFIYLLFFACLYKFRKKGLFLGGKK